MVQVKYGISTKFILFISITLLFFFAVSFFLSFNTMRSYALNNAQELSSTILEETDRKIDRFFLEIEYLAEGLAHYRAVYNIKIDDMKNLFISIVTARKQYLRAIYLGTQDGRMFEWGNGKGFKNYTPTMPEGYDPRIRPWYLTGLKAGGFAVSEPYIYASVEALGITGVIPVYNRQNKLVGILGIDILLDDLKSVLENLEIPKQGKAVLLNRKCDIIASQLSNYSGDTLTLRKFKLINPDELTSKHRGSFVKIIKNKKMYFSYKINKRTNWILLVALPYNLIMESVNRILYSILMINIFLMIMIIVALSLISEKLLINPLEQIITVINRLENGEKHLRVKVKSRDELGILAKEFNKLADTVEEYSRSLEKKVRERTDEIALLQKENTRLSIIEEKKRIYRDMHDALGAKLTNIFICNTVAQSLVQDSKGKLGDMLRRVEVNCQAAIKNLKDIIFGMKNYEQFPADFSLLVILNMKRRLNLMNIELQTHIENPKKLNSLDKRVKDEIEKIFQELTTNTLTHSHASKVFLEISPKKSFTKIIFSDNGIGFNYEKVKSKSSGLANLVYRVNKLGGELEVVTNIGQGSKFKITIPEQKV
ncbi:MAG: HAMP domain-containing protein [Spirochaetales bacterium]|nr:HAMP domain-containing protein [Spirochaetales bacterium]